MKNINIIFIPALMCTEKMYSKQFEAIANINNITANIHTFTIKDIPDIKKAAEYIINEIKKITDDKCYLVGTSLGGYVAMEIIKQNPNLIKKACLINTTWSEDTDFKIQNRKNIIKDLEIIKDDNFIGINDKNIKSYLHNITTEKINLLKEMANQIGRQGLINQHKLALSRTNYKSNMLISNIPFLIIGSEFDEITNPSVHYQMNEELPLSDICIIDNCSHLSPIDSPYEVSKLLLNWIEKDISSE